ncbi:MAG: hypothetical protein PHY93_17420 [Bacteriovorax sp.]|nr:hypothetical protein [Bacteriovorax sp.]
MLKGLSLKFISLAMLLSISSSFAQAESLLTKLPFGIKIGVTKNSEIGDKGRCAQRIQVSEGYFRCQEYDMANGKFWVKSSQNEIVSSLAFSAASNNVLPTSWRRLGLELSPVVYDHVPLAGTLKEDFITIIRSNNAENISTKEVTDNQLSCIKTFISFDVGNYHFDTVFITSREWTGSGYDLFPHGLTNLEITEAY